jgi:hypothetical protein
MLPSLVKKKNAQLAPSFSRQKRYQEVGVGVLKF